MRTRKPEITEQVEAYGQHPLQVGEWFAPLGDGIAPTVVLIHGGFWGERYDRHLEYSMAKDLAQRGYLCWNIDYRSSAEPWPATLADVAAAYDHLTQSPFSSRVDRDRLLKRPSRLIALSQVSQCDSKIVVNIGVVRH